MTTRVLIQNLSDTPVRVASYTTDGVARSEESLLLTREPKEYTLNLGTVLGLEELPNAEDKEDPDVKAAMKAKEPQKLSEVKDPRDSRIS